MTREPALVGQDGILRAGWGCPWGRTPGPQCFLVNVLFPSRACEPAGEGHNR